MVIEMDIRECANCGRFQSGGHGCGKYVNTCMQDRDAYSHWIPKSEEINVKISTRQILTETISDIDMGSGHIESECEKFGFTWGCKSDCPVFERGDCELQEENEERFYGRKV